MKKYLSLFLCFIAVIALVITGCGGTHGYGSDAANGPLNIKEWEVKDGKVTAELGGFKFSFDESNMKDGIFVTLKQLEATDTSTEPELVGSSYIYDLKAILKKSGTLESDVTVKTLEKAADITIRNDIPGADRYLLGMRNEGDNDWSYSLINDDNETNPLFVTSARFSSALASLPEFKIKIYNLNRQFRLFAYKGSEEIKKTVIASAKLSESSKEQEIKVKNKEVFLEDLPVEVTLNGFNSDSLTAADFEVKVHYQTSDSSKDIEIDGSAAKYEHSDYGAGSGDKYANTISFNPLQTNFSNSAGIISIKFLINLKDLSPAVFAANFTVEVTDATNNALPFSYTDNCKLTLKEVSDEPSKTDITVSSTFADKIDAEIKPSVEITFDNAINWSDVCTKYVTMTKDGDTAAIAYSAAYDSNKNVLTITPENNLAYGTKYTVSVSKSMPVPENYQITEDYTFSFATVAESEYTLTVSKGTGIATVSEGGSYKADTEITLEYTLETGYEFDLWVSSEVTVDENNKFIMPSKDVNVTANAKIITYKISYDGLDGADEVTNPKTYDVTSATITLNNPTKENYDFIGWTGTGIDEGTASMTVIIPQGSTGNKTYTANWTPVSYTITYNLDGGSLAEGVANPPAYDVTSATITLNNPTKANYVFLGWTGTGIEEGTVSMTVTIPQGSTGDREYVASWTMASVLKFKLPGDVTLEMRRCQAGSFVRGEASKSGWWDSSDGDGATVTISKDFYMGTYEVTNAQYKAIMGICPSLMSDVNSCPNHPVENVSWNDIMTDGFIANINTQLASQLPSGYKFALPTEAQWEYACRASTTTDLNSGKNIESDGEASDTNTDKVAWNRYKSDSKTHDVGGLASNTFGLYDMHGNVWEWCADWYGAYNTDHLTDPTGPTGGSGRVMRGGGWDNYPVFCTSWYRIYCNPDGRECYFGFRLALVPVQE